MKTFKLVSLSILPDVPLERMQVDVDLIDGLIINREDSRKRWIIEAFVDKKYADSFSTYMANNEELHLKVTITDRSNDPALVAAKVMSVNVFSEHISVLFDAKLERTKFVNSEMILAQLLEEGLQGDDLLKSFNSIVHEERKKLMIIK
ncbi:YwpF family protein [Litchfieldia salsa]|uniref:YwpF-like protein n=1 Tax=Litchfieldia salsa TaxID=930152 RepID=A0A1H0U1X4_9BACI|nr:YwpF family protein [Litchfieldia salsa]SDP60050.1 YwpF-like protein [Litchfieldia salsa]